MPGKGPMPAPNCNPGSAAWTGTEDGHGEDHNNALAAFTAALQSAENKANALMGKFENQPCPGGAGGCPHKSTVRDDPVITATHPIQKEAVKGKGMVFVCDLSLAWSSTVYCYKTAQAKNDADQARENAKREKEEKAKKDGK